MANYKTGRGAHEPRATGESGTVRTVPVSGESGRTGAVPNSSPAQNSNAGPTGRLVVLGLLLFGAALALVALLGRPHISLRTQSPPKKPTLVVLPFENLSGDPDLELVASDLPRDVVAALSGNERFESVTRESSLGLVRRDGLEAAAARLGADYVIAGSVDEAKGRIAVDAYFFRAGPQPGLWVERIEWDRSARDSVAAALGRRIGEAFRLRY